MTGVANAIARGAISNVTNSEGFTSISLAIIAGQSRSYIDIRMIAELSVCLYLVGKHSQENVLRIVEKLLETSANVHAVGPNDETALMLASFGKTEYIYFFAFDLSNYIVCRWI